ncbi:hypothetical protein [Homoserinibacter sp. GY 40078]|uniref:hypothetical protein n=1 Tax=Homoserinibacter sp. GY 40078 TaxID=2603275 RepID=UPI0011C7C65A|nr:hypothetical protein [Homoserinibacter sp. GY 40078]TXK17239.1 hypothetical protein FVQ89_10305 [Homoserinibacter sp. GY 40078]
MPTEAELRALLRDEDPEPGALDADRIVRLARRRRRPRQLAAGIAGGALVVAAVGFVVPPLANLAASTSMSAADEAVGTMEGAESAPDGDAGAAQSGDQGLRCAADGSPVVSADALEASLSPLGWRSPGAPFTVTARLTNLGGEPVSLLLSRVEVSADDGSILAVAVPDDARRVDLDAGATSIETWAVASLDCTSALAPDGDEVSVRLEFTDAAGDGVAAIGRTTFTRLP